MCPQLNQGSSMVLWGIIIDFFFLPSEAIQSFTFFISEAMHEKFYQVLGKTCFTIRERKLMHFALTFFFFNLGIIAISYWNFMCNTAIYFQEIKNNLFYSHILPYLSTHITYFFVMCTDIWTHKISQII